ncbi:hypothetical protein VA7868_02754 [Vibrio aerogenes CECT 7868]|uniref:Uncharacterized protein n=1 Tax=Vibrio aerogenes CECT 7868 TaxID=1216006 RepID=A0A1M5ZHL7_9VIBR|nr:hypothetical protein VA7868_02754 [Vibrio aerogenes CECT 7868]
MAATYNRPITFAGRKKFACKRIKEYMTRFLIIDTSVASDYNSASLLRGVGNVPLILRGIVKPTPGLTKT